MSVTAVTTAQSVPPLANETRWRRIRFTNLGLLTVDTLGEAFAARAIGLALVPIALLLARGCAMAHAGLAARILSPSPGALEQSGWR